jgi:hypothetical protein
VAIDLKNKAPNPDAIARMLSDLLGVPTTTKLLPSAAPATALRIFGTYVDDKNRLTWIAGMDIAFAASTGSALAMLPMGLVTDAIKTNTLTPAMIENSREVANVSANLFNTISGHGHVRLAEFIVAPSTLTAPSQAILAKPVLRVDLEIAVRGYPPGKIALFRAVPFAA